MCSSLLSLAEPASKTDKLFDYKNKALLARFLKQVCFECVCDYVQNGYVGVFIYS